MGTFSNEAPVRAAVTVEAGRIVAQPFAEDGRPTESEMDFGPEYGADLRAVFEHVRYVFSVKEITG